MLKFYLMTKKDDMYFFLGFCTMQVPPTFSLYDNFLSLVDLLHQLACVYSKYCNKDMTKEQDATPPPTLPYDKLKYYGLELKPSLNKKLMKEVTVPSDQRHVTAKMTTTTTVAIAAK